MEVLCSCRNKGAKKWTETGPTTLKQFLFNEIIHYGTIYVCLLSRNCYFPQGWNVFWKVASLQMFISTHALLLPFFPPSHIHCPPFWLWPSSQWLVKVQVGPYQVGVSRTSPHCCFRDHRRPAMVPKENPCFFCCASSESLCSSSCMCEIFMLYYYTPLNMASDREKEMWWVPVQAALVFFWRLQWGLPHGHSSLVLNAHPPLRWWL